MAPWLIQSKRQILRVAIMAYMTWLLHWLVISHSPLCSLHSSPTSPLLFLQHSKCLDASGPLHLLSLCLDSFGISHLPFTSLTSVNPLEGSSLTTLVEKKMATHSSILAWEIPWTEEPDRLQSMGLQRVGHDWVSSQFLTTLNKLAKYPPHPHSLYSYLLYFSSGEFSPPHLSILLIPRANLV